MEIAPIPGIRAVGPVKAAGEGLRQPAIFEIDAAAKLGDGEGQVLSRKAAGAEEDEADDEMLDGGPDEERSGETAAGRVDYFA